MKAAATLCLFTAVAVRSQDPSITTESGSVVLTADDVIFRTTGLEKTASGFVADIETLSTGVSSGFAEAESARITLQNTLAASIDTGVSTIQEALSTSIVNEQNARDAFAEGLETSCNVTAGEAVVSISGGSATCSNAGLEAVQRTVDAAVASTRVYETRINDLQRQLNESQGGFECARRRQDAVNTAESTLQNGTLRRRMRCPNGRPPQKLNARSFRYRGNINRYDGPDHSIRVPEANSYRAYSSSHGDGRYIFDGVLRHWSGNNYRAWHVRPGGMEVKLPRPGILLNFIVYCIRNTGSMTNPDERGYQCYDHGRYDIEHGYVEYYNGREWVRSSTRTSGQYGNWIGKTEMQCGDAPPTNWRFVFDGQTHPYNPQAHIANIDMWVCY